MLNLCFLKLNFAHTGQKLGSLRAECVRLIHCRLDPINLCSSWKGERNDSACCQLLPPLVMTEVNVQKFWMHHAPRTIPSQQWTAALCRLINNRHCPPVATDLSGNSATSVSRRETREDPTNCELANTSTRTTTRGGGARRSRTRLEHVRC